MNVRLQVSDSHNRLVGPTGSLFKLSMLYIVVEAKMTG